jgi:hypothetical protein
MLTPRSGDDTLKTPKAGPKPASKPSRFNPLDSENWQSESSAP